MRINNQGVIGMGAHKRTFRVLAVFLVPLCLGLVSVRPVRGADDAPQPERSDTSLVPLLLGAHMPTW